MYRSFPVQMPSIFLNLDLFCTIGLCMPPQMVFLLHLFVVDIQNCNCVQSYSESCSLMRFFPYTHMPSTKPVLFSPC